MCGFSVILILKGIMTSKSKSPCFLLNKKINFISETESKMEGGQPCASGDIRITN